MLQDQYHCIDLINETRGKKKKGPGANSAQIYSNITCQKKALDPVNDFN
jgi:hypothetical protein